MMTDDDYNATVVIPGEEPVSAEDAAFEAQYALCDAALDWVNAAGPAARAEAEEKLYQATIAYAAAGEKAWGEDGE